MIGLEYGIVDYVATTDLSWLTKNIISLLPPLGCDQAWFAFSTIVPGSLNKRPKPLYVFEKVLHGEL